MTITELATSPDLMNSRGELAQRAQSEINAHATTKAQFVFECEEHAKTRVQLATTKADLAAVTEKLLDATAKLTLISQEAK